MILEIWLWLASVSMILFAGGIIYAKIYEKVILLAAALPFMLLTALYAFNIEYINPNTGLLVSQNYSHLAWFFSLLAIVTIVLMFAQVMWGIFGTELGKDETTTPLDYRGFK